MRASDSSSPVYGTPFTISHTWPNFIPKEAHGLSFQSLQLIGVDIDFIAEPTITAKVVSDHEVEFEGKKWKLSPLTREIQTRRGLVSPSGSYSGAQYWEYDGIKLSEII